MSIPFEVFIWAGVFGVLGYALYCGLGSGRWR